jgi:hypothetical protein
MSPLSKLTRHGPLTAMLTAALTVSGAAQGGSRHTLTCTPSGPLVRVAELPEGSGSAASRQTRGRSWSHNDSGTPELVAMDANGKVVGRLRVEGAVVEDWEAIATGPCPAGACIYIGDIGDNDASRRNITIYRFAEPAEAGGSVAVRDAFRATYPDGAHDAEALLVTPKGDVLIVTKGDTGAVALYRLPPDAKPGSLATLQRVGAPRESGKPASGERITDGAVSPSGSWIALRTNSSVLFYQAEKWLAGDWQEAGRVSLDALGEPQGEGIAFADDKTLYLVGEGGGKQQPGTFGRLSCTF